MAEFTVSLVQMAVQDNAPAANWDCAQAHITEAARRGADVVVLPELWDAGVDYRSGKAFAQPLGESLFAQVTELAHQHNLTILGSIYEQRADGVYNTLAVTTPDGIAGAYRKMHLFPLMDEPQHICAGRDPLMLEMPWGRTGFAICYDLRFPELFRQYAHQQVPVVIMSMAWPHPRLDHYQTLLRARAIENQCYMIAVNRAGQDAGGTRYFGHSCVIDPWGRAVVEAGETPAHLTVSVDLALVDEVRRKLPALDGLHPNVGE